MLLAVAPAAARVPAPDPQSACEAAITAAQERAQLPPGLLPAIALVESGRPDARTGIVRPWPWTINVAGLGFFFPTKAAAIAAVQALQDLGIQSIDVGCLQVNLMYHPAAFANLEQAFDPTSNARFAAHFLDALYGRTGDWTQAAGDYHSQTPTLGASYRAQVLARWHPPASAVARSAYRDFMPSAAVYGAFRQDLAYAAFAQSQTPYRASKRWSGTAGSASNTGSTGRRDLISAVPARISRGLLAAVTPTTVSSAAK
jgi:hypothetical protein